MSARVLVTYYSRSGHTRQIAERIANALDADVEELVDSGDRSGVLGYLRSGFEALFRRGAKIAAPTRELSTYALVVIGTPIWNLSVSSPVRTYLVDHQAALPEVAFFCTYGGSGASRAFAQMAELCGKQPIATLDVRERQLEHSEPATARFVARLAAARPAADEPVVPPRPEA
jgi:flavodoxin